ncbi:hypothetical protein K466DRAFT_590969 [Polyporus arcularius HHB13444]|uniref:DUF6533 domain-containing protein n=1 Tax=Polyporus arcularius HHB13444 TaxID=1314778 RepID=A0A5C3NWM3_9APHY|nr:hypothetical protein K466DRAFT_590969 [Polyporus arcularius HHB13444]
MASQYDPALVSAYNDFQTSNYVAFATTAWIFYESLITFDSETRLFWTKRLTGASVMFFVARYTTLAYAFVNLVGTLYTTISDERCNELAKATYALGCIRYIPFATFAGMRTLALTRSWTLATIVLVFSLAPAAVNFTQLGLGVTGMVVPIFGCSVLFTITLSGAVICTAVSRTGAIIGDFLLVAITWRRLAKGPIRNERGSLVAVVIWNGILYFSVLFVLNVLHLGITLSSLIGNPAGGISFVTNFTDPVTSILICRFLIDLQQASIQDMHLGSRGPLGSQTTATNMTSLDFTRAMGAMGSVVLPDEVADEIDDVNTSLAETKCDTIAEEHELTNRAPLALGTPE